VFFPRHPRAFAQTQKETTIMRTANYNGQLATVLATVVLSGSVALAAAESPQAPDAGKKLLQTAGVQGGLIVHLGGGDGQLTAALRANDGCLVHGLDQDPANVEKVRELIRAKGLYGPVSVELLRGGRLPYADNLVNLLVISDDCDVPREELLRVLAPGGVALATRPSSLIPDPLRKPRPAAGERLYLATHAGTVLCFGETSSQ
jgi:SAM-dependent methyltransferase